MGWEPRGQAFFFSDDAARQHLTDWLFLQTLEDMRQRSAPPLDLSSRYRVLGLAPLLRKLLADGKNTMLHAARRPSGRPTPVFYAAPFFHPPIPDGMRMLGLGVGAYANAESGPLVAMDLDTFLALRAGHVAGHDVTVLDVIQHYAYVEGGVHLGVATTEASRILQLSVADPPPGYPLLVAALAQITTVVLEACTELERIVEADYERRRTSPRPHELESPNARLGLPEPGNY